MSGFPLPPNELPGPSAKPPPNVVAEAIAENAKTKATFCLDFLPSCPLCPIKGENQFVLYEHIQVSHPSKAKMCFRYCEELNCNFFAQSELALSYHSHLHHKKSKPLKLPCQVYTGPVSSPVFNCLVCNFFTTSRDAFEFHAHATGHTQAAANRPEGKCPACQRVLSSLTNMFYHWFYSCPKKTDKWVPNLWKCEECEFACFFGEDMERHLEGHEERRIEANDARMVEQSIAAVPIYAAAIAMSSFGATQPSTSSSSQSESIDPTQVLEVSIGDEPVPDAAAAQASRTTFAEKVKMLRERMKHNGAHTFTKVKPKHCDENQNGNLSAQTSSLNFNSDSNKSPPRVVSSRTSCSPSRNRSLPSIKTSSSSVLRDEKLPAAEDHVDENIPGVRKGRRASSSRSHSSDSSRSSLDDMQLASYAAQISNFTPLTESYGKKSLVEEDPDFVEAQCKARSRSSSLSSLEVSKGEEDQGSSSELKDDEVEQNRVRKRRRARSSRIESNRSSYPSGSNTLSSLEVSSSSELADDFLSPGEQDRGRKRRHAMTSRSSSLSSLEVSNGEEDEELMSNRVRKRRRERPSRSPSLEVSNDEEEPPVPISQSLPSLLQGEELEEAKEKFLKELAVKGMQVKSVTQRDEWLAMPEIDRDIVMCKARRYMKCTMCPDRKRRYHYDKSNALQHVRIHFKNAFHPCPVCKLPKESCHTRNGFHRHVVKCASDNGKKGYETQTEVGKKFNCYTFPDTDYEPFVFDMRNDAFLKNIIDEHRKVRREDRKKEKERLEELT